MFKYISIYIYRIGNTYPTETSTDASSGRSLSFPTATGIHSSKLEAKSSYLSTTMWRHIYNKTECTSSAWMVDEARCRRMITLEVYEIPVGVWGFNHVLLDHSLMLLVHLQHVCDLGCSYLVLVVPSKALVKRSHLGHDWTFIWFDTKLDAGLYYFIKKKAGKSTVISLNRAR